MLAILKLKTLSRIPNGLVLLTIGFLYFVYMESFLTPLLIQQNSLGSVNLNDSSFGDHFKRINVNKSTIYFCILHFLLFWFTLSYLRVVYTSPGHVPSEWSSEMDKRYKKEYLEQVTTTVSQGMFNKISHKALLQNVSLLDQKYTEFLDKRGVKYCIYCMHYKPERTHHCRQAGMCVLKMDHYCNWVMNCIGFKNYKFFLVFILYTSSRR